MISEHQQPGTNHLQLVKVNLPVGVAIASTPANIDKAYTQSDKTFTKD
jgi:hypothetical protein